MKQNIVRWVCDGGCGDVAITDHTRTNSESYADKESREYGHETIFQSVMSAWSGNIEVQCPDGWACMEVKIGEHIMTAHVCSPKCAATVAAIAGAKSGAGGAWE